MKTSNLHYIDWLFLLRIQFILGQCHLRDNMRKKQRRSQKAQEVRFHSGSHVDGRIEILRVLGGFSRRRCLRLLFFTEIIVQECTYFLINWKSFLEKKKEFNFTRKFEKSQKESKEKFIESRITATAEWGKQNLKWIDQNFSSCLILYRWVNMMSNRIGNTLKEFQLSSNRAEIVGRGNVYKLLREIKSKAKYFPKLIIEDSSSLWASNRWFCRFCNHEGSEYIWCLCEEAFALDFDSISQSVEAWSVHFHVYSNLICCWTRVANVNIVSWFNKTFLCFFLCVTGSPSSMPHMPYEKSKMIDITRDKPIKVSVRVVVPTKDHPKVRIVKRMKRGHENFLKFLAF